MGKKGFTLIELLMGMMILAIVSTAGAIVFISGQNAFVATATRSELQANMSRALQRLTAELQQSGRDNNGVLKVTILDGSGVNGSDILRFSIPICVCGSFSIGADGEVSRWGAPMVWGQNGCNAALPVGNNGKVDVCHSPPGNPGNAHTLNVSENAVKAHLAHGDYIGDCGACSPDTYTNVTIEYLIDANGRLYRRVLDASNSILKADIFAYNLAGFQAVLNAGSRSVSLTVQMSKSTGQAAATLEHTVDVILRNGG